MWRVGGPCTIHTCILFASHVLAGVGAGGKRGEWGGKWGRDWVFFVLPTSPPCCWLCVSLFYVYFLLYKKYKINTEKKNERWNWSLKRAAQTVRSMQKVCQFCEKRSGARGHVNVRGGLRLASYWTTIFGTELQNFAKPLSDLATTRFWADGCCQHLVSGVYLDLVDLL